MTLHLVALNPLQYFLPLTQSFSHICIASDIRLLDKHADSLNETQDGEYFLGFIELIAQKDQQLIRILIKDQMLSQIFVILDSSLQEHDNFFAADHNISFQPKLKDLSDKVQTYLIKNVLSAYQFRAFSDEFLDHIGSFCSHLRRIAFIDEV